jgi:hypothetical protein
MSIPATIFDPWMALCLDCHGSGQLRTIWGKNIYILGQVYQGAGVSPIRGYKHQQESVLYRKKTESVPNRR